MTKNQKQKLPRLLWDYGRDENGEGVEGAELEVEVVDCEYNRMIQAQIDKPTNLTEVGF